jgi:hypothetical protein
MAVSLYEVVVLLLEFIVAHYLFLIGSLLCPLHAYDCHHKQSVCHSNRMHVPQGCTLHKSGGSLFTLDGSATDRCWVRCFTRALSANWTVMMLHGSLSLHSCLSTN